MITDKDISLPEGISLEACGDGYLIYGERPEKFHKGEWSTIDIPGLDRYCAMPMRNYFMSLPFWGSDLSQIKPECQFLVWQAGETYGVLIPLIHGDFRTTAKGIEGGLSLVAECGPNGNTLARLPLAYVRLGNNPYEVMREGMADAVRFMGLCRLRSEKQTPDFVNYLGWCTWDAFYDEVDQARTHAGLKSFAESGFMPGFVIVDEGWQDCNETAKFLQSYGTDDGFDDRRLTNIVRIAKEDFGVRYVGVWRTLFGALRAMDPEAPAFSHLKSHMVKELFTEDDWFGVIEPESVAEFQEGYAAALDADGIDFVKVDFQSSLHLMTYDHAGRVGAMTNWQRALQDSVDKHFGGMIINCMCGSTDAVYNFYHSSVTRTADDFGPKDNGLAQAHHVVQNAFNGLYMGEVCICDWDMFWSEHPWAEYHAMARAVSGGPIYVSDRPGHTNAELLKKLVAADGKVLRFNQPALPTADVLFSDFEADQKIFKVWNTWGKIGVLGLFHPHSEENGKPITETITPMLVEGLANSRYAVFSTRNGFLGVVDDASGVAVTMSPRESDVLTFSPIESGFAPVGLVGKYNPAPAILARSADNGTLTVDLRGGGPVGVFCEGSVKEVTLDGEPVGFEISGGFVTIDTGERANCRLRIETN